MNSPDVQDASMEVGYSDTVCWFFCREPLGTELQLGDYNWASSMELEMYMYINQTRGGLTALHALASLATETLFGNQTPKERDRKKRRIKIFSFNWELIFFFSK